MLLPVVEQSEFADQEWVHFCSNVSFNQHKLYKYENTYDGNDPRADEEFRWTLSELGNVSYMSLHCPAEFRTRWSSVRERFIELHKMMHVATRSA